MQVAADRTDASWRTGPANSRLGKLIMQAGYWFVQPYRIGGNAEAEQPCVNCEEVVAKVEAFKRTNTDPHIRLRVHVPSHAT
jgi:hypothetical protein